MRISEAAFQTSSLSHLFTILKHTQPPPSPPDPIPVSSEFFWPQKARLLQPANNKNRVFVSKCWLFVY